MIRPTAQTPPLVRRLHSRGIAGEIEPGDFVVHDDHAEDREAHLRAAIRRHLARCPFAGDTAHGIVTNWLPRRGYEDAPRLIGTVVDAMVGSGELTARKLPGGQVMYVRGPALKK